MNFLKERVLKDGVIVDDNVLQVSGFLNHMVDTPLLCEIGKEFANIFRECKPTKIITVEASGIHIATVCALELQIPFVIAKKQGVLNLMGDFYHTEVFSFTKQACYCLCVSKKCIKDKERILIIDDFLAYGNAIDGLIRIINEANAVVVGVGICIEKSFLQGASKLMSQGINLHSLVRIKSLEGDAIALEK